MITRLDCYFVGSEYINDIFNLFDCNFLRNDFFVLIQNKDLRRCKYIIVDLKIIRIWIPGIHPVIKLMGINKIDPFDFTFLSKQGADSQYLDALLLSGCFHRFHTASEWRFCSDRNLLPRKPAQGIQLLPVIT